MLEFDQVSDRGARVRLRSGGRSEQVRYERIIDAQETKAVEVYIDKGQDQVIGADHVPFKEEMKDGSWPIQ
ncbi:MAG: hypothetical protein ABI679_08715 [Gemmatimonadota bacterium]